MSNLESFDLLSNQLRILGLGVGDIDPLGQFRYLGKLFSQQPGSQMARPDRNLLHPVWKRGFDDQAVYLFVAYFFPRLI